MSTPEAREFWRFVDQCADEVAIMKKKQRNPDVALAKDNYNPRTNPHLMRKANQTYSAVAKIDIRPCCVSCGKPWMPPDGIDAQKERCYSCLVKENVYYADWEQRMSDVEAANGRMRHLLVRLMSNERIEKLTTAGMRAEVEEVLKGQS